MLQTIANRETKKNLTHYYCDLETRTHTSYVRALCNYKKVDIILFLVCRFEIYSVRNIGDHRIPYSDYLLTPTKQ